MMKPSMEALAWGNALLRTLGRSAWPEVEALFVLSPFPDQTDLQFTATQVERLALDELDREIAKLHAAGPVGRGIRCGRPSDEILAEVHAREIDLVILGTHGRSGLERFMLGSVASGIVGRAGCSVLVARG